MCIKVRDINLPNILTKTEVDITNIYDDAGTTQDRTGLKYRQGSGL